LTAYADGIILIAETENRLKRSTEKISYSLKINEKARRIGLTINENKTKFMILPRREHSQNVITVKDMSFERVQNFKYIGVDINSQADSYKEIYRRIITGNKCYYLLIQLFTSKKLSRTKIRLYKTLVRPIVLCACGARASIKSDEKKLMIYERKILCRIFGPKRNEEGGYEIRSNRELNSLFNEPNIAARE
jgi:hypothetical protein